VGREEMRTAVVESVRVVAAAQVLLTMGAGLFSFPPPGACEAYMSRGQATNMARFQL
jgi:hypothetical protein